MGEPIIELDSRKVEEIVDWLRKDYERIVALCEANGLPKPPPW